jgi:membrane associated rhomboid family serine protease
MRPAAVGFHCPECVAEASRTVRQPRTVAGGAMPSRPGLVTMVLVAINVLAFLPLLVGGPVAAELRAWGAMLGISANIGDVGVVPGVAQGAYWRLLTSAFLHAGILHIAFNMYALFLFGPTLERLLGWARFLALYLACAISGSVMAYWFSGPLTLTLGASGAVFGLFGAALILLYQRGQDVSFLLLLLGFNVVLSFRPGISWQGHLGGLVAGLLIGAVVAYTPRARRNAAQIAVYGLLIAGLVVATIMRTAALT